MQLGIYGAGSLGKELYDIAIRINTLLRKWDNIFFIDDIRQERNFYLGEVYRLSELKDKRNNVEVIIANGTPYNRQNMLARLKRLGFRLTNIIDPSVIVSPTAKIIGKGTIILPFARISSNTIIEENTLIQPYVCVSHDVHIGANSVFSANVSMGGKLQIGEGCYFGLGACIREELEIGAHSVIGMGAVVLND